jgi:hypothetical protein
VGTAVTDFGSVPPSKPIKAETRGVRLEMLPDLLFRSECSLVEAARKDVCETFGNVSDRNLGK